MIDPQLVVRGWDLFFFAPTSVYPIAVFRILLASILLYDAIFILRDAQLYLGPHGVLSYARYRKANAGRALSLFLYLPGTARSVDRIMALHIVGIVALLVGLATPVAALTVFVTTRSIVNRSWPTCNGGDNMAKIMAFLLIFTPCGHALSLDAVLMRSFPNLGSFEPFAAPWAQRLIQIQLSIIYLYTVYWKLKGLTWRNGTAVYYALSNEMYRNFSLPTALKRPLFIRPATWGVLVGEVCIGLGIWVDTIGPWMVGFGLLLHLAIETFLSVHLFGWYMIAGLSLFLNWDWLSHWL
jgi:uncharacterized membrane protein YphA (DoxX/SURF4 family)